MLYVTHTVDHAVHLPHLSPSQPPPSITALGDLIVQIRVATTGSSLVIIVEDTEDSKPKDGRR